VDGLPPYYAISYTWNGSILDLEVECNGKILCTNTGSRQALEISSGPCNDEELWIDVICLYSDRSESNCRLGKSSIMPTTRSDAQRRKRTPEIRRNTTTLLILSHLEHSMNRYINERIEGIQMRLQSVSVLE
jgi:hypothetical protein